MAKRTGSSARVENAPRRAAQEDVEGSKPVMAKGSKKRAALVTPPRSGAHARRSKEAAPSPRSSAQAKRSSQKAVGGRAQSSKGAAAGERLRISPPRQIATPSPRLAGRATPPPQEPPVPPPGHESARPPPRIPTPPIIAPRSMELEWTGDPGGSSPPQEAAFDRWVRRGDELLRRLAEHGASEHEYRLNLNEGRFFWIDEQGRVSAEARAQLLCTFVPQTSSVTMGWADLRSRAMALPRVPGMPSEIDDIDEEGAWRIAMAAAEHTAAQYLYRVRSPSQCLFLSLSGLTFAPSRRELGPSTPVALVLATLGEARVAAHLGAEPVDTLRARLTAAGATLLEQAEYVHRDTDWVPRLTRTGKRLGALAERLPRPTFFSVAAGANTMWLEPDVAKDLVESIGLLEEEWRQFA